MDPLALQESSETCATYRVVFELHRINAFFVCFFGTARSLALTLDLGVDWRVFENRMLIHGGGFMLKVYHCPMLTQSIDIGSMLAAMGSYILHRDQVEAAIEAAGFGAAA